MATRKGNRLGLWVIVILLVIGLGGWYTGSAGGRTTSVGSVNGLDIPVQDYATALRSQLQAFEQQTGQPLDIATAQALGIDRQVLSQVVSERVLDAEAQRLGLSVGDARVAEAIVSIPAFQGLDGMFDRETYREALRRIGLDEQAFETSLREDSTRTIIQAAALGGLPEPETYGAILAAFNNESRSVTWAALDTASVAVAPQPAEADLRAYYEGNPDNFTAPEIREVSYAWLTPEMVQDAQSVDDAAVRTLYDERIDEFVQEERRLVERLVFPTAEDAQDARVRLDDGEVTFEALVEERGLLLSDADLGDVARDDLGPAADPVFAADSGDVVGPLDTSLGPAFFRVNAVLAADEVPFEEAAPSLRAELQNAAAREAIGDALPEVQDLVAGGATMADLEERTDLQAGSLAYSDEATEGPAAYAEIRDAIAAASPGDAAQVVELEDGGLAVIQVDAVIPPALRPFDEARAEVEKAWQAQALRDAVLARAQAAAEAISQGVSFEDQDLLPQVEERLTRRSQIEGTTSDFSETAFALAAGEATVIPTDTGALVLRVDSVAAADAEDEAVAGEAQAVADQVSGALAQDVFEAYARAIQAGSEVRIDDRAITAVHAQLN